MCFNFEACAAVTVSAQLGTGLAGHLCLVIEKVDVDELRSGSDEAFPRNRMPIVRLDDDDQLVPELRQWGFIMMMKGKTLDVKGMPKPIHRDVFNAVSEKLTSGFPWPFAKHRCLIPTSSWDEWSETGAGKQRVRVSIPSEPVFMAAGLYDASVDPKTGRRSRPPRCARCRQTSSAGQSTTWLR